jgi:hypothetical protein
MTRAPERYNYEDDCQPREVGRLAVTVIAPPHKPSIEYMRICWPGVWFSITGFEGKSSLDFF